MLEPLTPTLKRKSSLKKIIISSPSQEIIRFLNLPNPAANEDPRSRIHIFTPKSKNRSLSKSEVWQQKSNFDSKLHEHALNRDCFIRKRNQGIICKKSNVQHKANKLILKSVGERVSNLLDSNQQHGENDKRLDVTFGCQKFWNCIKV